MAVTLSIWRATPHGSDGNDWRLLKGNAIAAHVVRCSGGWRVLPNIAGRRASRKGWLTAEAAVRSYFGANAATAITYRRREEAERDRPKPDPLTGMQPGRLTETIR